MKRADIPLPEGQTARLLAGALVFLVVVVTGGTLILGLVEPGLTPLDALYAVLNTVTTVGRGMGDFSGPGKLVILIVMVLGVITATLVLGLVTRAMVEGQIRTMLGRKRMEKQIDRLRNHVIVCGYGRMGRYIAQELATGPSAFVVVENSDGPLSQLEEDGHLAYRGDAASDDTLVQCRIAEARALISVTSSDADNVFVTLSARQLNPSIYIVARANEDSSIEKLRKAGANRVFSPYKVGGRQMALAALRPNVIDFLTDIGGEPGTESYQIEELRVDPGSAVAGKSLRDLNLSRDCGVIVIGLRRGKQPMIYNPRADARIEGNDIMIAIVPTSRLKDLAELVAAGR
jgi:voltage-gated potassium channel